MTSTKVTNWIKSFDQFGAVVNFNFGGSPTLKTLPGGFVSLFMKICFLGYAVLQFKYMINKETWKLNQ